MSKAQLFSAETFQSQVLESPQPVLVDFYADWCAPCRVQGPIVEELADEYEGRAVVGKVDVDAQSELAGKYLVRSIPTLIVFKDGQAVDRIVGTRRGRSGAAALHAELQAVTDEQLAPEPIGDDA